MNKKSNLLLTLFIGSLLALAALSGVAVYRMQLLSEAALDFQKKTLLSDYDVLIKSQVQSAVSLLAMLDARAARGELTIDEAKKQGADLIRHLRYQKEGYFWVDTVDGTNIVLLGKPSEGKNRINLQDIYGKYIIREIIIQGRMADGGYTDYWFPKLGSTTPLPKRGYSLEFKPWGWVVGTGNYLDDIYSDVTEHRAKDQKEYATSIRFFSFASFLLITSFLAVGFRMFTLVRNDSKKIKLVEENLQRSEAHFRQLFNESPDAYTLLREGIFIDCNKAAEKLLGCNRDQIFGHTPEFFSPQLQPDGRMSATAAAEKISETLRSGTTSFEWLHRRPDGSEFWAEISISVMDLQGQAVLFNCMRDITARKLAETRLAKLSRAVEQSPVTIVITDTSGIIEYVNPHFTQLTGYTSAEAIGQNPRILKSGNTPPEVFEDLWQTITAGKTWEGDVQNKSKDGTQFWEHATISALRDTSGTITHYLAVKEDVTEKKAILLQLTAAKEQAEAANLAKSQFLATMSHEIRTPMNGVIGMSGILLETDLNEEQKEYADIICKSGENLLALINDILDFSKIEAGKIDLELLDFDLRTTLEDTAELFSLRAAEKELELICRIDPVVPSYLRGDPGRLRQIITNLVGNSIKFTHQGEVLISAKLSADHGTVVTLLFEITDTGIGIPPERLDAVFAPFTQVDGSTTRKYGGTGLGLSISRQLVELMGGEIGITSDYGSGSTFWFTARFEKQPDQSSEVLKTAELLKHADFSTTRMLVVDDNATNQKLMITLLEHWGCRCEAVADAEAALALLSTAYSAHDPFRLILVDQEMPAINGQELGRRIKADPLLASTLMIMVTSLGQRGDAALYEQIGFAGYLSKPVRQSQLHDCIALVLERTQQTSDIAPISQGIITRHTVAECTKPGVRILLAEDNIINQKVAQNMLGKLGYKADVVADGSEAVRALELINYDLVLMDCQMPEMDGFEATAVIRDPASHVRNHRVPIIAMTANAMQSDRENCLAAGMDDYLSKPVKKGDLAEVIEKWVRQT
jgi:PAS domain S-box-containing protein